MGFSDGYEILPAVPADGPGLEDGSPQLLEPVGTENAEKEESFSDGEDEGMPVASKTEATVAIAIEDYGRFMVGSMSVGVLTGAIFMIVGLAVLGIVKIFKKI